MAFKENMGFSGETLKNGTFNVDMAVGGKEVGTGIVAPNRPTDMQLCMYMSWKIYRDGDFVIFPQLPNESYSQGYLDYNSEFAKTRLTQIIWRFQTDLLKAGKSIYRDGRCDKALGQSASISKTRYTIHHLNHNYALTIKRKHNRDDWQDFLMNDIDLHVEARQEIAMRAVVGV